MTETALIVEDSLTVRMDLVEAFEASGFECTPCASLTSARAALTNHSFTVAVLDVNLPDGSGMDLLEEIRGGPAGDRMVVLLLTSEADVADRVRGLHRGADDYVGKPYDRDDIVDRARELARSRRQSDPVKRAQTILLVDDSATFRRAMRAELEVAGYVVVSAVSGEEGLRMAAAERPSAVIVDGHLPGIDGATMIRRLRLDAALRDTPCLLLTGSDTGDSELAALESGADAFIRKGEDVQVILARLAAALRAAAARLPRSGTESLQSPKRILAVDDSPTYLDSLHRALQSAGYDVVCARSGEEAVALLTVQAVDCILLDFVMPGLDGKATCEQIKAAPRTADTPVIMLTSREDPAAVIEGLSAGADDYIAKSSDLEVVKARVRAQLRRKQFEDENRRIREELVTKKIEAAESRAVRDLAESRAVLLTELEFARAEAVRASQFKSEFLANMSHELRTPLNAIIGFSELLETPDIAGALNGTQAEFVGHVLHSGRHLLTLINDILDLSTIEAGRIELRRAPTPMGPLIESTTALVQPLARRQGVALSTHFAGELPTLDIDAVRIKQVLYNLLTNAIKFTPLDGSVRVEGIVLADRLKVSVTDTGIGIAPGDLHRLFQAFGRIRPNEGPQVEGTGLGLVLTKRLVELHGGAIHVASEPGVGSTFSITLPA